jgi:hypothetical protein
MLGVFAAEKAVVSDSQFDSIADHLCDGGRDFEGRGSTAALAVCGKNNDPREPVEYAVAFFNTAFDADPVVGAWFD